MIEFEDPVDLVRSDPLTLADRIGRALELGADRKGEWVLTGTYQTKASASRSASLARAVLVDLDVADMARVEVGTRASGAPFGLFLMVDPF